MRLPATSAPAVASTRVPTPAAAPTRLAIRLPPTAAIRAWTVAAALPVAGAAVLAGCEKEAPSLLPHLDGRWEGWVQTGAGGSEASADLRWDDEQEVLAGEIVVHEEAGDRAWTVLEGISVEGFGVTLLGVEQGGVRELQVDALAGPDPDDPFDPLVASWRTKWFCAGEPDGYCHEDGGMQLERR